MDRRLAGQGTVQHSLSVIQPLTERLRDPESMHRRLDNRLKELVRRVYPTPAEQREISELKKRKLQTKDEIQHLRNLHVRSSGSMHPS